MRAGKDRSSRAHGVGSSRGAFARSSKWTAHRAAIPTPPGARCCGGCAMPLRALLPVRAAASNPSGQPYCNACGRDAGRAGPQRTGVGSQADCKGRGSQADALARHSSAMPLGMRECPPAAAALSLLRNRSTPVTTDGETVAQPGQATLAQAASLAGVVETCKRPPAECTPAPIRCSSSTTNRQPVVASNATSSAWPRNRAKNRRTPARSAGATRALDTSPLDVSNPLGGDLRSMLIESH